MTRHGCHVRLSSAVVTAACAGACMTSSGQTPARSEAAVPQAASPTDSATCKGEQVLDISNPGRHSLVLYAYLNNVRVRLATIGPDETRLSLDRFSGVTLKTRFQVADNDTDGQLGFYNGMGEVRLTPRCVAQTAP